jgi:nucleotide-binding universal stress UspA family protein
MEVEVVQQTERETSAAPSARFSAQRLHLENILVPTDFSQSSIKALTYGIAMARQFDATLWLLHIVEPTAPYTGLEGVPIAMDLGEQTSEAESKMAEFAATHVPPDVSVSSVVRHGAAVSEIADMAKTENIGLMIASTHHHNRLTRALFGGITERVIHHAPCPVLIVREQEHDFVDGAAAERAGAIRMSRILAPIDFSECSKKALKYALAFAGRFNAQITCLHVVEPEQPLIVLELEGVQKTHEREARNNLQALLQQIDGGIPVEAAITTGAAHREIVHMADKQDADLIIIGEHCRTGAVGRFMLGSTADEVVRNAHCPVLVVRPQEHEFIE